VHLRIAVMVLLWTAASIASATEAQDARARELYAKGKAEFDQEHYQAAYDLFKQAFLLSPVPPLRWNMAAALQGLGRPHDAAEELRTFLRLSPHYPDQAKVEARIRVLEEAQRLLDSEATKKLPAGAVPALIATPPPWGLDPEEDPGDGAADRRRHRGCRVGTRPRPRPS
jgi:tetratricopeptide (TPR) repeat protein